jgi:drug/metabolite transporter (DMT)-like permease
MTAIAASSRAGVLTVVLTLIGWSSVPLFIKHFSHSIDVWTSNGWRYGFSALLWAPVLLWAIRRARLPAGIWRAAVVPSAFNALGQICFAYAHYQIEPGLLTFGLRTQIIFVAIGAFLLFPAERRVIGSKSYIAGVAMVFAGTIGTVMLGDEPPQGATALGIALAIASGLLFACYALSVRHYMRGTHPVLAFAVISQYTAAAMVALMLALGARAGAEALALSGSQFGLLLLSAVIGIALGHVFYYISIARLGVAVSSGVIQLQPFLVAIASGALFGERLTFWQWLSGAVAIGGALLMLAIQGRIGRAAPHPHPEPEPEPEPDPEATEAADQAHPAPVPVPLTPGPAR